MTSPISVYLENADDSYAPANPKPPLQQFDNYQIHDLYCEDIYYPDVKPPVLFRSALGVQRVSPYGEIECDFESIALEYP